MDFLHPRYHRSGIATQNCSGNCPRRTCTGSVLTMRSKTARHRLGWHRDFADARGRLRDWVVASGTRRIRDRPTRQTPWPGEENTEEVIEQVIHDREVDFVEFVLDQVRAREAAEDAFYANIDLESGEVRE